ncbi:ABC transporter ATP-binding protein [Corynebacterium sp. ES2794-CONJ1]|uniref:ABC transporter ATP-binding protein n=1 Tax=unclassified Corynebacterium TaxID=2624378 RepID=UPI0021684715|nr:MULTISPECIES: ABC transporter ATP-binding protein [unclassified Corynebacterium]MCS4489994.1 ABC transporter ATP-binding protein [Corynebacterium sp. ES2775-CONJ]MCS4491643.1 ABC transporter ATP-binding protein [Corynebacterium sp. ES2715-CONJ3]MCS4531748.1 ABC transporter ATP-binding protein [Corynebacterium sp. ES2730-CONJ]MCU9519144.1 ABC transporter ATP-binding protein [Corynebacterium sp. ES2794-CONJ1]
MTSPQDVPVIELKNVHVVHTSRTGKLFRPDKVHAVNDVSMKVFKGKTLGIVGESGCGKSTTARVMVGLQKPTGGEVLFRGKPAHFNASGRKEIGRAVSVVFQDPATALNPRMIIRDALTDPMKVHGIGTPESRVAHVKELLDLVGLPQSALDVLPRQISGGQRQRVAIARALVLEPDVIIADEPTSALDVSVRAQVLNLLVDLKERLGLGLVFISHDINTVRFISDRIAVMYKGSVVEEQSTTDIFNNAHDDYTKMLLSAVPSLVQESQKLY